MVLKGGLSQGILDVSKVTLDDVVSLIVKGRGEWIPAARGHVPEVCQLSPGMAVGVWRLVPDGPVLLTSGRQEVRGLDNWSTNVMVCRIPTAYRAGCVAP